MPDWLNVDQRVDHALNEIDKRTASFWAEADKRIDRIERIINGLTVTNTTAFNVDEKTPPKAEPA